MVQRFWFLEHHKYWTITKNYLSDILLLPRVKENL